VPRPSFPPTAVATAVFGVPAADVWAYRLDFTNLSEYNPDVSGIERVADGTGVGGRCGPGARYTFHLADPRRPGESQPVELWMEDAVEPTLVTAGMRGGNEAYEEFEVRTHEHGCEATLTLWVTLPAGLPDRLLEAAAAGSFDQINKELILMQAVLEGRAGVPSAP
jgi:hypothetical protein